MDKEASSERGGPGILYVVATPIGNLEDITLRALRILSEVDLILAEHQTVTRRICDHYDVGTKIATYNQHSSKKRTESLVGQLERGMCLALVSDAGTPGISDPGIMLISAALDRAIEVMPIPGPCAAVAGLSVCGFSLGAFCFEGFLSNRPGRRRRELAGLATETRTMVFYESPHRIRATLSDMAGVFGPRPMVMFREMTKMFEEIKRGTPADLLKGLTSDKERGEFTLVVSGRASGKDAQSLSDRVLDLIEHHLKENTMSVRDIAGMIAENEDLAYRKVYKECLARKSLMKDS